MQRHWQKYFSLWENYGTHRHMTANGPTSTKQSGLQSGCLICVSM